MFDTFNLHKIPRCPWKTKLSVPGRRTLATALLQGVAQPRKAFSQSPDHHLQSRSLDDRGMFSSDFVERG